MPKGIMRKIFVTTTALMLLFFIFLFIFQNTYLSSLYKDASVNTSRESFETFIDKFATSYNAVINREYKSDSFTQNTKMPLIIFSEQLDIVNSDFFSNLNYITITTEEGEKRYLLIHRPQYQYLDGYKLVPGAKVAFKGIPFANSVYIEPFMFSIGVSQFYNSGFLQKWDNISLAVELTESKIGSISSFQMSNSPESDLYKKSKLLYENVLNNYLEDQSFSTVSNKTQVRYFTDTVSAKDYAIIQKTAFINGSVYYFFTLQTLDNLSIAFNLIYPYYISIYIGFLIILTIASYFYSKWLSTPLLYLNGVATKIANLDFSEKVIINTGDELQELSESLNFVSENLEKTITDLEHSNKRLSDEALKRFEGEKRLRNMLSNLSHEFKTPLSIIMGMKNVIEDELYEKEPQYYFDTITNEINRLNGLINETIELTKLESGYFIMNEESFNISSMIKSICKSIGSQAARRSIKINQQLMNTKVIGDVDKIEQVLLNFLDNAIKYSPVGSTIVINNTLLEDGNLLVEIINEGEINETELNKIWTRYYRSSSSKDYNGTGLGLEITKKILEQHNSNFGVTSKNGKINFCFTLPVEL